MSVQADGKPGGADGEIQINIRGCFGPNTVDLATQAELDAHTTLTTTAHGGIVADTDARLTDARTPTPHATSHESGGSDPITLVANNIPDPLNKHGIRTAIGSNAAGLYVPWVTGDTAAALAAGSLSSDQVGINTQSGSSIALLGISSTNAGTTGRTTSGADGGVSSDVSDTGTVNVPVSLSVRHNSSGTPAAGFGVALALRLKSSTTANQDAGQVRALWTDATHATRTSDITLSPVTSGTVTERARVTGAGALWVGRTSGGLSGAGDVDASGNAAVGGTLAVTGDTTLSNAAHSGYGDYAEISTPSTPAANKVRLYAKDKSSVSTLYYKDDAGTEHDLSTNGTPLYLPWTQRVLNPFPLASSGASWGDMGQPWAVNLLAFYVTVYVATTNNGTNFWTISLVDSSATVLASVTTSAIAANTTARLATTTITQPSASNGSLGIIAISTLSPGAIYIWPTLALLRTG